MKRLGSKVGRLRRPGCLCGVGYRPPPGVLARSGALPLVQHRYACRNSATESGRRGLRYAQTTPSTLLRYASVILRSASLSPCTLLRSVKKRCPALLRRAGRYLCGVGYRPPPSAQQIIACLLVGVVQSGTLVAPYGRSAAFPLLHLSPSLATLGHLPRWGIY